MFNNSNAIWITWENQRRSVELSKALGVNYYGIYHGNRLLKFYYSSLRTIKLIIHLRPKWVFVQNPSNVLAALACFLSKLLNFKVIVDRHSNFIFTESDARKYSKLSIFVSNCLSKYSIKNAKLTIVTNNYIKDLVKSMGGKPFILQDKLPQFNVGKSINLKGGFNVIFPCTFSPDEPVNEVVEAGKYVDKYIYIYITGSYQKYKNFDQINIPQNVIFTGFLPEEDYQSLLLSGDVVLALTERPHTLLCCAYEGVALHKPLILSEQDDLIKYFYKGSVITKNNSKDIAKAIDMTIQKYDILRKQVKELRQEIENQWSIRFNKLKEILNTIE